MSLKRIVVKKLSSELNSLRILFIAPLPPPIHGSAVVSQQIKSSRVINDALKCDWVNLSTSRRMNEIGKNSPVKVFRLVGSLGKAFLKLLTHRYNFCYLAITCHGIGFLKDAPFALLCKLFGRKIVLHQHNKGMANDVERWPYRWLLPLVYRNATVILLSWYLYPDIEMVVPKENVVVCPNGIVVDDSWLKVKETKGENAVPHLLFLSNLMESKGVLILLDALKLLTDKGVSFVCDIVGGETKEINARRLDEEIDRRQLKHVVFYHGRKMGKEKEFFFNQSDVFLLPTSNDCFPLVLLEAMAHCLPIVTTGEGGIPDMVQDGVNGIICRKQDSVSLAYAIEQLTADSELRKQMGIAGRERLEKLFTEDVFERKILEILSV